MTPDLSRATWRKSSRSQPNGSCVEVASDAGSWTAVRDSKNPFGPVLAFAPETLTSFVVAAKLGEYDQR